MLPGKSWRESKKLKTGGKIFSDDKLPKIPKYAMHNTKCDNSAMMQFFSDPFARRLLVAPIFKFVVPSCFFAFIA